jgi:hypothetical protein
MINPGIYVKLVLLGTLLAVSYGFNSLPRALVSTSLNQRGGSRHLKLSTKDEYSSLLASVTNVKSLGDVKELVSTGDNMFRIHSVGAAFFGALLLLFPEVLISSGPIASFAYVFCSMFFPPFLFLRCLSLDLLLSACIL